MAREYRYADAVRLLGGQDPAVRALDTVLGAATLGALPLVELIEAKNELVRLGNDLLGRWRTRQPDGDWLSRTERVEAAHTILVVQAFFTALDTLDLPFRFADLEMTRPEQTAMAVDLHSPVHPSPGLPFEDAKEVLEGYYADLAATLRRFVRGLTVWDTLGEPERERVSAQMDAPLAKRAVQRYEDDYRQLMADVPEFAHWAGMIDHAATRAGLASLGRLLKGVGGGRTLPEQLDALARTQRAVLKRPVAETGDVPQGMRLPTLEQGYITPRFLAAEVYQSGDPSVERWWDGRQVRTDLPGFLAGYLTTPQAAVRPLVVLGQPGAGKSVLTKVLSGHLPDGFLPIRVPLRDVAMDGDIQRQIEAAIYQATGERLEWPALARAAAGSLPVVLLDGFDELLQATGVRQSDYLERIEEFQRRERDVGRAVAVIVTSRTAVAHRARMPEGTVAVRLEPFDRKQIGRWLKVWNTSNAPYFANSGVRPLTPEVVGLQPQLAEQPLLLMMLALYDAQENVLQSVIGDLGQAELYERLVRSFAARELKKQCPAESVPGLLERELLVLSLVAFAMFNRGRQWATAEEVTTDIAAMLPPQEHHGPSGFHTPLTSGEQAFGRFFFVHRSQATRDDNSVAHTYEFLHATFGEFLIARLILLLLHELARHKTGVFGVEIDDTRLCTLLSWATISTRMPIVTFLQEMVGGLSEEERVACRDLIVRLFKGLDTRRDAWQSVYSPWTAGPPRRYAYYSANLLLLALACQRNMTANELMPGHEDVVTEWQRYALLWRSQCAGEEWESLFDAVQALPSGREENRDVALCLAPAWVPHEVNVEWVMGLKGRFDFIRQSQFSCTPDAMTLVHTMEPISHVFNLVPIEMIYHAPGDPPTATFLHRLFTLLTGGRECPEPALIGALLNSQVAEFYQKELVTVLAGRLLGRDDEEVSAFIEHTLTLVEPAIDGWTVLRDTAELLGLRERISWPTH